MITTVTDWAPDPTSVVSRSTSGKTGNAWDASPAAVNGLSYPINVEGRSVISVFGNTSGAATITLQYSQDGETFKDSSDTISANGDFGKSFSIAAAWLRLKSSAAVTITATIASK